jgi:hypothetical protein
MNKNIIIYFSFHGSATGRSIILPPNVSLYFSCSHGEEADDSDPLSEIFEGTFHNAAWIPPDWSYKSIQQKLFDKSREIIQPSGLSRDYFLESNDSGDTNSGIANYVVFIFEDTPSDGYTASQINGSLTKWTELIKSNCDIGARLTKVIEKGSIEGNPVSISQLIGLFTQKYPDFNIHLAFSICRQESIPVVGGGKKRKNKKRRMTNRGMTNRGMTKRKITKRKRSIRRKL